MSESSLPARAIYGWDATNESWVKIQVTADGELKISAVDIDTILSEIQDSEYGLSALKTLIDAVGEVALDIHSNHIPLLALEATLTAMKGVGWTNQTLKAIKDAVDAISAEGGASAEEVWEYTTRVLTNLNDTRAAKIDNLDAAVSTRASQTTLDDLQSDATTIKDKTDGLPSDPADESLLEAELDKKISHVDFWSTVDDVIPITATADQDYDLPDVIIPTLPTGITIWKVVVLFKCALIRDTSGSDNGIDEAGLIRVKKSTDGSFDANGVTAFNILDNMWLVDVTNVGRDRSGDVLIGDINGNDISAKVTGAGTWNLRLDSISADGSNLELHDVQVGLRVYFY